MLRRSILATVALACAASVLAVAPAAHAAKPGPTGPMTVTCTYSGSLAIGRAFTAPTGTKSIYFQFHRDEAAYLSPYSGSSNGGTDFDGRDGWMSWGDPVYADAITSTKVMPGFMSVEAYDRKGRVLSAVTSVCPAA